MPSKGNEHVTYTYDENDMLKKIMVGETESELGIYVLFAYSPVPNKRYSDLFFQLHFFTLHALIRE